MTNEQIRSELAYRMTQKYLIYLALQEIMLDNYEDVPFLKDFNLDLLTKHRNMVSSLKRNASKAFRFMQNYDQGEVTIKQFHSFVKVFEALHTAIDQGGDRYARLLDDLEKVLILHGFKEPDGTEFTSPIERPGQ
ncbi:MAG: hypothetical protein RIR48_2727 [Bacteroidota bacterium]|jgi:hypothetical protein